MMQAFESAIAHGDSSYALEFRGMPVMTAGHTGWCMEH